MIAMNESNTCGYMKILCHQHKSHGGKPTISEYDKLPIIAVSDAPKRSHVIFLLTNAYTVVLNSFDTAMRNSPTTNAILEISVKKVKTGVM
jgi:hypothetical protein